MDNQETMMEVPILLVNEIIDQLYKLESTCHSIGHRKGEEEAGRLRETLFTLGLRHETNRSKVKLDTR